MTDLIALLTSNDSYLLIGFLALVQLLSWRFAPKARRRPAIIALLMGGIHLLLAMILANDPQRSGPGELRFLADLTAIAAVVIGGAHLLFDTLLMPFGILKPVIVRDLSILMLLGLAGILTASRAGFALSGVIATSAVLTAVIGLSLQDTLGNIIGGISLQLDSSLAVGDWIKVGEMKGRVVQIGWRCTTIETNDWETILLPNSVLMRGSVIILARRSGSNQLWRRWVRFHVPLEHPPAQVISIVQAALALADIPHQAEQPAPSCICTGIDHGCGSYAVRYWLDDPLHDDSTDSRARSVVVACLARHGIQVSAPVQNVEMSRAPAAPAPADLRDLLLDGIPLFDVLTPEERRLMAQELVAWPVATGERLIRAGDPGDCLFVVARGKFSVEIAGGEDLRIGVARLGRGTLIGEMSLLTGDPRTATVTALTDSLCYRLNRQAFTAITRKRPELLMQLSLLLSHRQEDNSQAQREAAHLSGSREVVGHGSRLLQRMRDWLGTTETALPAEAPFIELTQRTIEEPVSHPKRP